MDKETVALAAHPQRLEVVDPPVHHVDSLEVDERFADLQAEQHQRYVCQRGLVLRQVGPQLQEHQHRTEVSHELAGSTASLPAVGCRLASYLPSEGLEGGVTNLSVRVELHDDPHGTFLNDPDQFDNVLMIEVLHNYWRQKNKMFHWPSTMVHSIFLSLNDFIW